MRQLQHIFLFLLITSAYLFPRPVLANQGLENNGNSPLMIAAYDGDLSTMRRLIDQGHDVNQTNKYGLTALFYAAGGTRTQPTPKGSTEAINFLLQHGAKVNIKSNINGYTTLMAACANQNAGSALLLLEHGADVNALTRDGESALSIAAARLEPEIVTLLLNHSAHVNGYADKNGQTPLIAAVAASPYLTLRSPDEAKEIIQQKAYQLTNALKVVKLLLANKADINIEDQSGKSALTYAVTEANPLLVRTLLDHGANPNVTDKSQGNATPLILATRIRYVSIAEMLIQKGANVSAKDQFGKSALDYSIERGPQKMVEVLRQVGAKD